MAGLAWRTTIMNLPIHPSERNEQQRNADNLEKHLDYMSPQVVPETTPTEMEDVLQEALTKADCVDRVACSGVHGPRVRATVKR
jgi:hypothetical protein